MRKTCVSMIVAATLAAAGSAPAATVRGGGSAKTDCLLVLEVDGANSPAPPKTPKNVDCTDGDATCDGDGLRNGECVFPLQICANSTAVPECMPDSVDSIVVDHAIDDGEDRRFDVDFQALQLRADGLGLPSFSNDDCSLASSITVRLKGPDSAKRMKKNKKKVRVTTLGATASGPARDVDKIKFTCRPEGDAIYEPTDLYEGTFDRIRDQIFGQSCALAGCHDSESSAGGLILLPNAAYGNIVNVAPANGTAAGDGLLRVTPGDETLSFLYLKISGDLAPGYGSQMPDGAPALDPALVELVRLWILGDGILGPAPETGWVTGTDQ